MGEVQISMQAFGGISIINAIPSWFGGTMAVNLRVHSAIKTCKEPCRYTSKLVETIVQYFVRKYSLPLFEVEISSEIPPMSGLKSSSAVAVSIIRAITEKYGIYEKSIPRLAAELSIQAGASITGALDDAAAAYYGGAVLTDNLNMKILRVFDPKLDLSVVLAIKGYREKRIDANIMRRYSHVFYEIFDKAFEGNILEAIKLNGIAVARILGYDEEPIREAIGRGALAAGISGNGPSMFALCRKGDEQYFIDLFKRYVDTIKVVDIVGVGGT
uniref:Shikimate kinase n=1 Tax=Ignisphaera aggregans TaxID=334771 RepID=A0A7J3MXW0_9CREN